MANDIRKTVTDPLIDNNPITLQVLGVCSAFAVTTNMMAALIMSIALTTVAGRAIPRSWKHPLRNIRRASPR